MAQVLARLHYMTGKDAYRERTDAVIAAFTGDLAKNLLPYAGLLCANEFLQCCTQIIDASGDADGLARAAWRTPNMNKPVLRNRCAVSTEPPCAGTGALDGRAAAYVRSSRTCSLPLTSAAHLEAALREMKSRTSRGWQVTAALALLDAACMTVAKRSRISEARIREAAHRFSAGLTALQTAERPEPPTKPAQLCKFRTSSPSTLHFEPERAIIRSGRLVTHRRGGIEPCPSLAITAGVFSSMAETSRRKNWISSCQNIRLTIS